MQISLQYHRKLTRVQLPSSYKADEIKIIAFIIGCEHHAVYTVKLATSNVVKLLVSTSETLPATLQMGIQCNLLVASNVTCVCALIMQLLAVVIYSPVKMIKTCLMFGVTDLT